MRKIALLGASGSIGTQTLSILEGDRAHFELRAISVGRRAEAIPSILSSFPSITHVCVMREADAEALCDSYPSLHVYSGDEGILSLIRDSGTDMVVNALVGFAGLAPSLCALEENKILCLANKESLVVGGDLIRALLAEGKGKLLPIDSEHVGVAKIFSRYPQEEVKTLYITGSGGSFRDLPREALNNVTPAQALAHPTWNMGAKITIDCATMMNKGFELIEANVLFDFPLERTEILMHRESCVHAAALLKNGKFVCDLSVPDMKGPIAYALYETNVPFELKEVSSLMELSPLHFARFAPERYPSPRIALLAYQKGGTSRAVLNAANEAAVYAFLEGRTSFLSIDELVYAAVTELPSIPHPTYQQILEADRLAREYVEQKVKGE